MESPILQGAVVEASVPFNQTDQMTTELGQQQPDHQGDQHGNQQPDHQGDQHGNQQPNQYFLQQADQQADPQVDQQAVPPEEQQMPDVKKLKILERRENQRAGCIPWTCCFMRFCRRCCLGDSGSLG